MSKTWDEAVGYGTRHWLAEYDLAHSSCPVDRRRAEKQQQEQARKTREAEQQRRLVNWEAAIDQRIGQYLARWWGDASTVSGGLKDPLLDAIVEWSMTMVRQKLEEERRAYDAKITALEERLWQLATGPASSQDEIASHDDEADITRRRDGWTHSLSPDPGRTAPPICQDLICGRHRCRPQAGRAVFEFVSHGENAEAVLGEVLR